MKIRRPNLARQLLRQLLPLMAAILISGAGVVYFVAHREATVAYDRALMDESIAIASQVEIVVPTYVFNYPPLPKKSC